MPSILSKDSLGLIFDFLAHPYLWLSQIWATPTLKDAIDFQVGATIDAQEKTDVEFVIKYHEKTQFTIRVRTDLWRGETVSGPRVPRKMVVIAHYNKLQAHECTFHRRRNLGGAPWLPGASIVAEMVGIYQYMVRMNGITYVIPASSELQYWLPSCKRAGRDVGESARRVSRSQCPVPEGEGGVQIGELQNFFTTSEDRSDLVPYETRKVAKHSFHIYVLQRGSSRARCKQQIRISS